MARTKSAKIPARKIILSPGRPKTEKREFILQYLGACQDAYRTGERLEEGDYVQGMYNAWKLYCHRLQVPEGTSTAFRQVIHILKNEGVIEHYATRPADQGHFWNRNYYRVILE